MVYKILMMISRMVSYNQTCCDVMTIPDVRGLRVSSSIQKRFI
jgi:hypothetical protein